MIFDALVFGHIRSNAWRALVSVLAIGFGVATALALALTNAQSIHLLDSDRALFTQRIDFQIAPFGGTLPQDALARVRYLDGVASADPIIDRPITIGVNRNGGGGDAARLIGVDVLQPLPGVVGYHDGRPGPLAPIGSFIDPTALIGAPGAIISSATAERLHLHRGAPFAVLSDRRVVQLRVANILPRDATGVDANVAFVDISTAQQIMHELNAFDLINIVTKASAQTVRPALAKAVGREARVIVPAPTGLSLQTLADGIAATFGTLASIGLAVGGLLVYSAVGTSIAHRRGDIGILRTLGVAPISIIIAFVGEGGAYGLLGSFIGAALAAFALRIVAGTAGSHQSLAGVSPWTIVGAVALGIVVAIVSSLAATLSATRIAPALSARQGSFEGSPSERRTDITQSLAGLVFFALGILLASHPSVSAWFSFGFPLCFALGTVLLITPIWRILGGFVRRSTADAAPSLRLAGLTLAAIPKRIGVTLAALAIAVFAAVAFDVASYSFATSLHAWVKDGIAGDMLVRPSGSGGTFSADVVAQVRATPGVSDVTAIRTIHTQTGATDVAVRGEDAPIPRVVTTEPPADVGAPLAAALHLKADDIVRLRTAHADIPVRVNAIHPDFSEPRGAIVIARQVLRQAFDDDRIDAIRLTMTRNTSATELANRLARQLAPRRIETTTTRAIRDRFTSVFDGTFAFVRALAVVVVAIAAIGVASALSALILERRFELRMLRTLGTPRSTIMRMLLIEALAVALFGSMLGVVMGMAFAAAQLYVADPVAIGFAIPLAVPLASVASVLIAAIVASAIAPLVVAPAAFQIAADRSR